MLESSLNHPYPCSMEKLSSTEIIPELSIRLGTAVLGQSLPPTKLKPLTRSTRRLCYCSFGLNALCLWGENDFFT